MNSTYKALAEFAQTWGLLYFVGVFVLVIAFAFWPSRKRRYEDAGHIPLRED